MTISCFHDQARSASSEDSKHRATLKREIRDFLLAASSTPTHCDICPRCGREMKYVEATFWLYGEKNHPARIRVPVCCCSAKVEIL